MREHDFGVWRLWDEIKGQYPHFAFKHGHGLGVLAVGPEIPSELGEFLKCGQEQAQLLESFFFSLGNRITLQAQNGKNKATIQELNAMIQELNSKIQEQDNRGRAREAQIEELKAQVAYLQEERARILKGASFRIGRIITAPLRLLLGKP